MGQLGGKHLRRGAVAALVLVALAAVAWVASTCSTSDGQGEMGRDPSRRVVRATAARPELAHATDGPAYPSWFVEPGLAPRRVAGVVVQDGAPAAGVTVTLEARRVDATLFPVIETTTAGDGRFDFGEQPPTELRLSARAELAFHALDVDLRDPTLDSEQLAIALETCRASAKGLVTDDRGRPLADVELVALEGPRPAGAPTALSDAEGHFSLCRGRRYLATKDGYGSVDLLPRPPADGWRIVLPPASSLRGRAVSDEGAPLGNVVIGSVWAGWPGCG